MEIRMMKYFLMVAREENMTRAAEILHVTQPTLSRQIMQLEEELNCKLFRRSNHNIYLTQEGMLLKKRVQDIVELEENIRQEFSGKREEIAGNIRIGSGETKGFGEIIEVMKNFQKKYSKILYTVYTANADDIKEKLDRGLVDFGVLTEPVDIAKYNFIRLKEKETWGILVRRDWKMAQKEYVRVEDIGLLPLIVVGRELVRKELSGWLGDNYEQLHIVATYNLINNAIVMARAGIGAVICMDGPDNTEEDMKFIPFVPKIETGSVLVWKRNQMLSGSAYQFLKYYKKCRGKL